MAIDKMLKKKLVLFLTGWEKHADIDGMPAGVKKKDEPKMVTWAKRVEQLSIFECQDLGEREAKEYMATINPPVVES